MRVDFSLVQIVDVLKNLVELSKLDPPLSVLLDLKLHPCLFLFLMANLAD